MIKKKIVVEKKDWLGNPTREVEKEWLVYETEEEKKMIERATLEKKIDLAESGKAAKALERTLAALGFSEEDAEFALDGVTDRLINSLMRELSRMMRGKM